MNLQILDNGVRLALAPRPSTLTAVYLWLEAGSQDEEPGHFGAAHFLEHLLFKKTKRRGLGEAAAEIEAAGGELNAFTSFGETALHATVRSEYWQLAVDVLVDLARFGDWTRDDFELERQVILGEIRQYADDAESALEDVVMGRLYPSHAYGRPILGSVASIRSMSDDAIRGFRAREYGPNRAIITACGDIDPGAFRSAVEDRTCAWKSVGRRRAAPVDGKATTGVVRPGLDFKTPLVEMGWRVPGIGHPDVAALDVLAQALGEGESSVLTTRLQLEDAVASDAWTNLSSRPGGGDLALGFQPNRDATRKAVRSAWDEVESIRYEGLPGVDIRRARQAILADFLFSAETSDGVAHDLAWWTARYGKPAAQGAYRDRVAAVSAADVRRVAERWLPLDRAVVCILDPGAARAQLPPAARPREARVAGRAGRAAVRPSARTSWSRSGWRSATSLCARARSRLWVRVLWGEGKPRIRVPTGTRARSRTRRPRRASACTAGRTSS